MPNRFNIADIDNEPEEDKPNNSDFFDEEEEIDDEGDELDCWACNATGEGYSSDTRCSFCHGRGTIKKKKY